MAISLPSSRAAPCCRHISRASSGQDLDAKAQLPQIRLRPFLGKQTAAARNAGTGFCITKLSCPPYLAFEPTLLARAPNVRCHLCNTSNAIDVSGQAMTQTHVCTSSNAKGHTLHQNNAIPISIHTCRSTRCPSSGAMVLTVIICDPCAKLERDRRYFSPAEQSVAMVHLRKFQVWARPRRRTSTTRHVLTYIYTYVRSNVISTCPSIIAELDMS